MDKEIPGILASDLARCQGAFDRAKSTREKHYARMELRRARANLASLGPKYLEDYDNGDVSKG